MNKNDFNLMRKMEKFKILSSYVHGSIGPEARRKGLDISKGQLRDSLFLIIVEGRTDKKFYERIFNNANSVIIDLTCGYKPSEMERKAMNLFGKSAVQRLFEKTNHAENPSSLVTALIQNNGALGLIDLDFDAFPTTNDNNYPNLFKPQQYINLLSTETNDLETLLLQYGVFNKLITEILNANPHLKPEQLRKHIYFRIKFLSDAFRLATDKYHLSWKPVLTDNLCSLLNLPDDKLCDSVTEMLFNPESKNAHRQGIREQFRRELMSDFTRLSTIREQNLSYCHGHTTMALLGCLISGLLHKMYREDELFDIVSDSCRRSKGFQKTQLYFSLKNWEDAKYPLKPKRMLSI